MVMLKCCDVSSTGRRCTWREQEAVGELVVLAVGGAALTVIS